MAAMNEEDIALKQKLVARIKEVREAAGFTQSQLAELLEIDRQTIFKWENDGVTIYSIARVCQVLNITLSDFFKGIQ